MRRVALNALFVLLVSSPCWADGASFGIGAGLVDPSNVGAAPWFTANVRFDIAKNIAIEPEAGFWKKSESAAGLIDVSIKDINFGANVIYLFPAQGNLQFSAGAGVGAHVLKGAVGVLGFTTSDSSTKVGVNLLAGLDLKLGSGVGLFANVRYDLVSDFNQFKVYGGFRFGGK